MRNLRDKRLPRGAVLMIAGVLAGASACFVPHDQGAYLLDDASASDVVASDVLDARSDAGDASDATVDAPDADTGADDVLDARPDCNAAPCPFVSLSAGLDYTLAVRSDGAIFCWGYDVEKQCGDIQGFDSNLIHVVGVPAAIPGLPGPAIEVAAGSHHACAVFDTGADGNLWCWGANTAGQAGQSSTTRTPVAPGPVLDPFNGPVRWAHVAVGAVSTCAIDDVGEVFCWGANDQGQLGNGTTTGAVRPVRVTLGSDAGDLHATSIAVGLNFACARVDDGRVFCWGANDIGQSGGPDQTMPVLTPTPVGLIGSTFPTVDDTPLSAGYSTMFALVGSNGSSEPTLLCWGSNGASLCQQSNDSNLPRPVTNVNALHIALMARAMPESSHFCVLTTGDVIVCWGTNMTSQTGSSDTSMDTTTPYAMHVVPMPTAIAVGRNHTCAIGDAGNVYCWGDDTYYEIGDRRAGNVPQVTPVMVDFTPQ